MRGELAVFAHVNNVAGLEILIAIRIAGEGHAGIIEEQFALVRAGDIAVIFVRDIERADGVQFAPVGSGQRVSVEVNLHNIFPCPCRETVLRTAAHGREIRAFERSAAVECDRPVAVSAVGDGFAGFAGIPRVKNKGGNGVFARLDAHGNTARRQT